MKTATSRIWTINGRFLTQNVTGVQRYGREILHALDALLDEGHPLTRDLTLELMLPDGECSLPPLACIKTRRTKGAGHLWEQVVLPVMARGGILSLCNTSTVLRRKQVVCVHDLNFIAYPQSYSFAFRALYRTVVPLVLNASAVVTTVSQYSASEIVRNGMAAAGRMQVVPNGHDHTKRWNATVTPIIRAAANDSTIVLIGSPAEHKNIGLILGLADELGRHGLRVAVVGRLDARVFQGGGAKPASKDVIWLGSVTDDELMALYRNCLCLAFPSRAEGFGLPPLEAMSVGCPVVSSNAASLPEVCGDAALYASPDDRNGWIQAFLTLRTNPQLRRELIQRGLERACLFSWRKSAEMYLDWMARLDRVEARDRPQQDNAASAATTIGMRGNA